MKTKILLIIIGLGIGVIVSPVLGMAISPTRNLIMKLAPQETVLALADKINERKKSEQQKSEISALKEKTQEIIQEEVQPEETVFESQSKIIPVVQTGNGTEQTEACQNTKAECEKKMKNIRNEIDDLEKQVKEQENLYDEAKEKYGNSTNDAEIKMLKYKKLILEKSEKDLKLRKSELQNITNGECKNYNKPC